MPLLTAPFEDVCQSRIVASRVSELRADHERVAVGRHGDTEQILNSGLWNGQHAGSDPP